MLKTSPVTLEAIKLVANRLDSLSKEVVFLGGSATGLLITGKAAPPVRSTLDVDVIVEITSRFQYYELEDDLRRLGFEQSMSGGGPVCRWIIENVIVDIMPTRSEILGFTNMWYSATIKNSTTIELDENTMIRVARAPYFLATKIEAFRGRGKGDFLGSHDIEDIITLLDGREELVDEIASGSKELKAFLAGSFKQYISDESFIESLPGHLLPDAANQARVPIVLETINQIIQAGESSY